MSIETQWKTGDSPFVARNVFWSYINQLVYHQFGHIFFLCDASMFEIIYHKKKKVWYAVHIRRCIAAHIIARAHRRRQCVCVCVWCRIIFSSGPIVDELIILLLFYRRRNDETISVLFYRHDNHLVDNYLTNLLIVSWALI